MTGSLVCKWENFVAVLYIIQSILHFPVLFSTCQVFSLLLSIRSHQYLILFLLVATIQFGGVFFSSFVLMLALFCTLSYLSTFSDVLQIMDCVHMYIYSFVVCVFLSSVIFMTDGHSLVLNTLLVLDILN